MNKLKQVVGHGHSVTPSPPILSNADELLVEPEVVATRYDA